MKLKESVGQYKTILKTLFLPNDIFDSVEDLPIESYFDKGIRALICDVDNTLVSYADRYLSLPKLNWINKCKSCGLKVYFISNNSSFYRIETIAKQAQVDGLFFAAKPLPFSMEQFMKDHLLIPERTAFVGDQLLTDVILGKWMRCHTILVDPLDKRSSFIKAVQKKVETAILAKIQEL